MLKLKDLTHGTWFWENESAGLAYAVGRACGKDGDVPTIMCHPLGRSEHGYVVQYRIDRWLPEELDVRLLL